MKGNNIDPLMSIFEEKCKEHHLKITPQRITIYRELHEAKDHPSIDTVFQRVRKILPTISFDTVYRTVSVFAEMGIIDIVEGYSGVKRFDANTSIHHHFVCVRCKRIIDFRDEAYNNLKISEAIKRQFTILKQRVILEGICDQCSAAPKG